MLLILSPNCSKVWGLSNLTFILVAWILYCLLPKLDGPGCYCPLTRRSLPLALPSKCPIWVWLRNYPPQFLNELKCRTPPMLVNHIKWPGGGGSQKVNPFLSEIFFHHFTHSCPPDWWCNMWATPHRTSPNPADQKCAKEAKEGRCSTPAVSPHCPPVVLLPPSRNDVPQQNSQQPIHTI